MARKRVAATFSHERSQGIGFRVTPPPPGWAEDPLASRHHQARAGAAAMRSAAYAARYFMLSNAAESPGHPPLVQSHPELGDRRPGDRYYTGAWLDEIELGCPAWPYPPRNEPCRRDRECGRSCEADGYGGFAYEGQRGGNGYAVEDVYFVCQCEHHEP